MVKKKHFEVLCPFDLHPWYCRSLIYFFINTQTWCWFVWWYKIKKKIRADLITTVSAIFFLLLKTSDDSTYRSMPSKRGCLYFRDSSSPPPQAASMWSHILYFSQMSAISLIGSKAPRTVVPAVAVTKNGIWPLDFLSNMRRSSSDGIMWPLRRKEFRHWTKTISILM